MLQWRDVFLVSAFAVGLAVVMFGVYEMYFNAIGSL